MGLRLPGLRLRPSAGILGTGDTVDYTATASEAMRVGTTMQITLSNDATVTLSVDANAPTTLTGTYTIQSSDSDDLDLKISQYTAQTAVDISGNALSSATADEVSAIDGAGSQSIVVDTQALTAEILATGHVYDAPSGVLTLSASDLLTLGATAGGDVTSQVDITKLSWDVNQTGASLEIFAAADVTSVVVTNADTLTITLTEAKRAGVVGTSNFGGSSAGADGLGIEAGFLLDNAGNASEQNALENAEVAMFDTDGPSITGFTVTPSSEGILGTGDTVDYTATASEAMRVGTTMQITFWRTMRL